jgi:predicted dehydrogenase
MPRTVVHGTRGSWSKFGGDLQETRLKEGMRPDAPGFGDDPDPGWFYEAPGAKPAPGANQRDYYVAMLEAIRGFGVNPVPPEDAVAVMVALETCFTPARQGVALPVQRPCSPAADLSGTDLSGTFRGQDLSGTDELTPHRSALFAQ